MVASVTPEELALLYLTTDFATIAQIMARIPYPKPPFSSLYTALATLVEQESAVYRQGRPTGIQRYRAETWKLTSKGVLAQQELAQRV